MLGIGTFATETREPKAMKRSLPLPLPLPLPPRVVRPLALYEARAVVR